MTFAPEGRSERWTGLRVPTPALYQVGNAARPGLRGDARAQCSTRGTDNVNSGIGASNRVPSSATIW